MLQKIAKMLSFFYYLAMEYNLKHYAYIGDCVWELFVRNNVIQKTSVQKQMHKLTTDFVNAASQANFLALIEEKLTETEKEIQKRGRNLKISINKKNIEEVIKGLEDLIDDRLSFVAPDDYKDEDNIFLKDVRILKEAIQIIKGENYK